MPKITTSTTINLAKSIKSNITSNETVGLATTSLAGFPTTRINTNGFTVSFWVKLDGTSTTVRHVYHDDTRTGVHGGVWFESTRLYFRAVNSGGTYGRYWSINYADYQEWVHVAITWDGDMNNGNTELFVNGVSEGAGTNALGTTSGTTQAITDLYIFDKYTTTTINGFELQGALVDFAMWSKEYSSVQIQNIYGGGEFVDYSALGGIYTPQLILWYRLGEESTISSLTTGDSLSAGTQFAAAYTQSGVSGATLTAQSNIDMEIVEGPYNVTTTTTTIYSGITSDTPRRTLRAKDAVSGQYPTIARTGDSSRMGNFNINFDDRNTIVFEENTTLLEYPHLGIYQSSHPLLKSNASAHSTTNSGVIVTTGSLVKGVSDDYLLKGDRVLIGSRLENDLIANGEALSGSVNITPFDESRISLGTSTFYMTGTAEDVYPGFSSRLHDKTQIKLTLPNTREEFLTRSPKNRNNILDPSGEFYNKEKTGFVYYNWDLKRWDQIGLIDHGTGQQIHHDWAVEVDKTDAIQPFISGTNNFPNQFFTYEYQQRDSSKPGGISEGPWNNCGMPHINSFAPHATKYYATSSQTLSMKNYINHPFLLEKIKIEFPFVQRRSHLGDIASNDSGTVSYGQILHQSDYIIFFYRQDNKKLSTNSIGIKNIISGSNRYLIASGCMSFYNNKIYNFQNTDYDEDFIPQNSPAFLFNHQITSTSNTTVSIASGSAILEIFPAVNAMQGLGAMRYPSSSIGSGDQEQTVNPTLWPGGTFYEGFGETKYTGREFRSGIYGGKSLGSHHRLFNDMSNNDKRINFDLLAPCVAFDPRTSKISASTIKFNEDPLAVTKGEQINVVTEGKRTSQSPYLLFPEDELIIGIDNPVSLSDRITSSDYSNETTGSFLKIEANSAVNITLFGSQISNKKEFHDTLNQNLTTLGVHEAIHFDNPTLDQFLIATKAEYSGSYMDTYVTGGVGSVARSIVGTGGNEISGSLQRFRGFDNRQQRFYDSVLIDIESMFKADGYKMLDGTSIGLPDPRIRLGSITTVSSGEHIHNSWHAIFPFEPRYHNSSRKISQTVYLYHIGAENDSLGNLSNRSNFSFLGTDVTVETDLLKRFFNSSFAAFSFGSGQRNMFKFVNGTTRLHRPKGFKYGILNALPQFTKNIYREDKFGQRADMLEQAQDSRFLVGSSFTSDGPLRIRFVVDDDDDEYIILDEDEILENTSESSNVSIYATSSLPFFDEDTPRNRTYNNTLFANRIIDIIGFNS